MQRVAIIGCGLSALVLAHRIQSVCDVVLFEQLSVPGGRMATVQNESFEFDPGAQFFTARTDAFREFLGPLIAEGVVAPWIARFAELTRSDITSERRWDDSHPHFVGVPSMASIGTTLARDLFVNYNVAITEVRKDGGHWLLNRSLGPFDWLVSTIPGPQAQNLLADYADLPATDMRACYALMLGFNEEIDKGFDASRVLSADISWISRNHSKPARAAATSLVVHSTNAWADANPGLPDEEIIEHLLSEFEAVTGIDGRKAATCELQRWPLANTAKQHGSTYYVDSENKVAACGDWFVHGRVEAAFLSAMALAEELSNSCQ